MQPHPKIQRRLAADGLPKDILLVLYGIGGIGKTTTACQAPVPLALDCAGGLRYQSVDSWKVLSTRDLAEALAYLKQSHHGYRSVILDGLDSLYHRLTRADAGRDLRDRHRAAQEALHPLLFDLWALSLTKIVVLNEHRERDDRVGRERVEMDLAPRTGELVDNAADLILHCEARPQGASSAAKAAGAETTVRARRLEDPKLYIQAKTRTDVVRDGMPLRDVLGTLGLA